MRHEGKIAARLKGQDVGPYERSNAVINLRVKGSQKKSILAAAKNCDTSITGYLIRLHEIASGENR
jgi:hypothetical protein